MFKYEVLILGELNTNCYLLWEAENKEAVVIDAADDGVAISEEIERLGLKLKYILATHGHFDHNLGALDLKLIYKVPYCASEKDLFLLQRQQSTAQKFLEKAIKIPNFKKIDIDLDKVEEIKLGNEKIKIIKSPGHTPGGLSFLAGEYLFTGDTVFAGGLRGDTKHSYGSTKDIFASICNLMKEGGETIILSGHGEETTVGRARDLVNCNYCQLPDLG